MRGAGTSIAGNAVGTGIVVDTLRHLNRVVVDRPGGAHRRGRARRRARRPAAGGGAVRPAVRSGPVDPHPLHDRRDDRQQRLRLAGAGLRPHRRQRGRAGRRVVPGRPATCRGRLRGARRRAPRARAHARSAGSPGRSAATRWSTCCPRTAQPSTGSWSARRAPSALVREATVRAGRRTSRPAPGGARLSVDGRGGRRRPGAARGRRDGARLVACEGLDSRIVDLVRARARRAGAAARRGLAVRRGRRAGARAAGRRVVAAGGARGTGVVTDAAEAAALWRIREDGAGLAARSLARPAYSGWEDAAVPPEHLGAWLRDFDELLREHGLDGVPYGHFGDGCVHVRIDFDFDDGGRAVPRLPDRVRAPAARARRLAVRRARRRPGPLGAAAADVRRGVAARSSARSRRSATPTTCSTPASRRPGAVRRRPAPGPAASRGQRRAAAHPRRRLPRRRGAPLHRRRQVRGPGDQRRDVPVVPRDPRREGLHPRPVPGAAGGARRRAGRRARRPGGARGARPLPGLQGLRVRLPDRRGHGDVQGRGAAPEVRRPARGGRAATTCSAGCRSGPRWPRRWRRSPTG